MAESFVGLSVRLKYVRVDENALLAPGSAVYGSFQRAGRTAVRYVQDELIRMDAVDSGELYNSIDYEIFRSGRGISVAVGPFKGDANVQRYARYVHDGTRGPITTKPPGGVMPVKIKGGPLLFLKSVKGQDPKPYLANALKKVKATDFRS